MRHSQWSVALAAGIWAVSLGWFGWGGPLVSHAAGRDGDLDRKLERLLADAGFTGLLQSTLELRLMRSLDPALVDLGRLLFFDNLLGLHEDNACAGCHSPAFGFGDSQSIAIGVQSNRIVGPERAGPRNQRRAPQVINTAFLAKLMWNGRFQAKSGDPFNNSLGFKFPPPEGDAVRFPPGDPEVPTLLAAQGHIPETELVEMAGFTGAKTNPLIGSRFHQFDDGLGTPLPLDDCRAFPKDCGFLNEEIRRVVLGKIQATPGYVRRFRQVFGIKRANEITFGMVGRALAEFQMSLTFADAPIDRFARGDRDAMTDAEKRGALLFFGKARCAECHAGETFTDLENRVLGVPQIAPFFGVGLGNVVFDGPKKNEDFGAEQITGSPSDRYKFRTSPIRNVALQPTFFHNGAFTRLEDAIRHHLNVRRSARSYDPVAAGVDEDLTKRMGPIEPVLARLDPLIREPIDLSPEEFRDLVTFVATGLLDERARPEKLCELVPKQVPSGLPVLIFQGCQ
jgi:cytochrome c peroxidase